jgi:hypothetical protein
MTRGRRDSVENMDIMSFNLIEKGFHRMTRGRRDSMENADKMSFD